MVTRRITYRLYPNRRQESLLHWARRMHCCLYNAAVANRKTQYQRFNHSVDYFEQQNSLPEFKQVWTEYKRLGSQTLQATLKLVDFAFKRFFKGLGKYPKFKSSRHYSGWDYPNKQSWKVTTNNGVNGYLNLRDLDITIQMRGKARTWGIPKTCTIFWRNRKWYASITVECCSVRQTGKGAIGLDFGSKVAVATSDGDLIESPKFLKQASGQITQLSKGLRRKRKPEKRKVKASRRWKKINAQIGKIKRKVANQRQDWTHKVAAQIVSGNSLVATEKLNLKGMTRKAKKGSKRKRQKAGLNRNLLDVAIGMLRESIKYKVIEAGGVFLEAPTQQLKPTQRCNKCWELTPKTLNDRVHICSHCGHNEDRDINAAQVCLTWARGWEPASLDAESQSSTDCGSMKQLWTKKRQKRPPL
ncbi:RNA-guided endonuclease InsQ/TnpB family protein [Capilliphycus salinus ALCB114379]|uniref:RNA-guided endonuclease InsQ/TnpB family protein n=1 Tax=Capilliphycus salinus TaxID=2768948 RepID=UPI0039A74881